jgi:hypothetical protein
MYFKHHNSMNSSKPTIIIVFLDENNMHFSSLTDAFSIK